MKSKIRILVFPCGSEIGLEVHRALAFSSHIKLFGASSLADHGKFIFKNYIEDLPFFDDPEFISKLSEIVVENQIDAIYPTMDSVISMLTVNSDKLGCKVICSPQETAEICLSKLKTYSILESVIRTPRVYKSVDEVDVYPVFMKPDVGYGSRGAKLVHTREEVLHHLNEHPNSIILENLPGDEYTVDCFTDRNGNLRFIGSRNRNRISNGISVNTTRVSSTQEFEDIGNLINRELTFRGAWFFQVKRNSLGKLTLLEVASRLGGSSGIHRNLGVNFALLSIFDMFDQDVQILPNNFEIEMDRALENKFKIDVDFNKVYIDLDDCLIIDSKVNTTLIKFIFQLQNQGKQSILLTKHAGDLSETLKKYRIHNLFDQIIHIQSTDEKSDFIDPKGAIFIDDSHVERRQMRKAHHIPVFAPDSLESLIIS